MYFFRKKSKILRAYLIIVLSVVLFEGCLEDTDYMRNSLTAINEAQTDEVQENKDLYPSFIVFSDWFNQFSIVANGEQDLDSDKHSMTVDKLKTGVKRSSEFGFKVYLNNEIEKIDGLRKAIENVDQESVAKFLKQDVDEYYDIIRVSLDVMEDAENEENQRYAPQTDDQLANSIYTLAKSNPKLIKKFLSNFFIRLIDAGISVSDLKEGKLAEQRDDYLEQLKIMYNNKLESDRDRIELLDQVSERLEKLKLLKTFLDSPDYDLSSHQQFKANLVNAGFFGDVWDGIKNVYNGVEAVVGNLIDSATHKDEDLLDFPRTTADFCSQERSWLDQDWCVQKYSRVVLPLPTLGQRQDDSWSCGIYSTARMLLFYGHTDATYEGVLDVREEDMIVDEQSTDVEAARDIFGAFDEGDVHVAKKQEIYAIKHLIRRGIPVLVAVDGDPIHWIVVSGFDENEGTIFYWDPYNDTEETYTEGEFDSIWHWEKGWLEEQTLMAGGFKRNLMMWINHPAIDLTDDEPPQPQPDPHPSNQINTVNNPSPSNPNMVEIVIDPNTLINMGLVPMVDSRQAGSQTESVRQGYAVTPSINSGPRTIYNTTSTYNATPARPGTGLCSSVSPLYTHINNQVYNRPAPRVTRYIAPTYRVPVAPSRPAPTSYISPTTTYSAPRYVPMPSYTPATSYLAPNAPTAFYASPVYRSSPSASRQASTVVQP